MNNHGYASSVKERKRLERERIKAQRERRKRLEAAAPNLLAVLQTVYQDIELQNVQGGSDQLNFDVQSAIAEATGETKMFSE